MKLKTGLSQSDIAMLILIVAIAMTMAYLIGNALINTPQSRSAKVEEVRTFSDQLPIPDPKVFVNNYINPTELIEIGNSNNPKPFGNQ